MKALQSHDQQITVYEITDTLFKKMRRINIWMGSLKALLVFHRLAHSLGTDFVTNFSKQKPPDYAEHKKKSKDAYKVLLHVALVEKYQNYLVKLTYNYEDFKVIFNHSIDLYKHLLQQNLTLLHLLSKVQNILTVLLKFDFFFEVCLLQFPSEPVVKQAAYFILTDCYYYYTFVNNNIILIIEDIFNLSPDEAIFLYEIYSENIQTTKKLKAFMDFRNSLSDFEIKEPVYYKLNLEMNKKIELFIQSLKAQVQSVWTRRPERHLSMGSKIEFTSVKTLAETDTPIRALKSRISLDNFDEEEYKGSRLELGPEKNIRDLSKNILKVDTPSFRFIPQDSAKHVFLPPKRKETDEKKPDSQRPLKIPSNRIMPSPTSVNHQSFVGSKATNFEETTVDGYSNPAPYFKKVGEKRPSLEQEINGKQYIAAHDTTIDRTASDSFADSFINPRNFEKVLDSER